MPADPAIEAAANVVREKGAQIVVAQWSGNEGRFRYEPIIRGFMALDIATAAIRAYLAAQPAERTAEEMRREVEER